MKQQEHPTIELRGSGGRLRRLPKFLKVLLILGVIFGVLVAATAIYVNFYVHGKFRETQDKNIAVDPIPPGRAYNILVLGSDKRSVVEGSERTERQFRGGGGQRADTILMIHVPADGKSALILSFPRDLRVKIPGKSGYSRINAAYGGTNGPNLMMETIRQHTGLKIHHYIEVNFSSFQKIVDAVGGVRLCPTRTYDDKQSGLIIKKAGCQQFDGKLALAWARMRKQDPKGDFGRIDRQQQFMRVLMAKVKGIGFLTDVPRLIKLANVAAEGVTTDAKLSLREVRGIANKLAGFKQSNVEFRVVPSYPQYIGGVAYVIERPSEARALFKALRDDTPLPDCRLCGKTAASIPSPEDVVLRVLNGSTTNGLAAEVRDRLRKLGFKVKSTANATRRDYRTTVIMFAPGNDAKAALVAQEFPGATVKEATHAMSVDIEIILGADEAARASPSPG